MHFCPVLILAVLIAVGGATHRWLAPHAHGVYTLLPTVTACDNGYRRTTVAVPDPFAVGSGLSPIHAPKRGRRGILAGTEIKSKSSFV